MTTGSGTQSANGPGAQPAGISRWTDLGGPVHYLDFGGEGDPVVMVHGLGGNALNWMDVGPGFAAAHHTVALDLAGFGETPLFDRSAAVGANAELVRKFVEELFDEPVILIGNSMGGSMLAQVASRPPAWWRSPGASPCCRNANCFP